MEKKISSIQISPKSCIHPKCTNKFSDKLVKPAFADISELEKLIGAQSSSSTPFLLCPSCYSKVYSLLNRVSIITSLWCHWLRCCWMSQMWQHSNQADIFVSLPSPEDSGWLLQADGKYIIDWEATEVQQMI